LGTQKFVVAALVVEDDVCLHGFDGGIKRGVVADDLLHGEERLAGRGRVPGTNASFSGRATGDRLLSVLGEMTAAAL